MDDLINAIFQLLQANKFEEIKNDYLLEMISFDNVKDSINGDTLLHFFFRQFEELLPISTFEFLLSCFFRIDHVNNDNKTAAHILLEKHPSAFKYFNCLKQRGIPLFQKKDNTLSIIELLISTNNSNIFQCLIENLNIDYIRKFYYEKFLSLAFKFDSILILDQLINDIPFNLYTLFKEFINSVHFPVNETDEESANYQFFLAIKNSKKKIFQKIFEIHPNDKFVTLEMLYHCTNTSFCIFLSKYIKEGEYSKIPMQNDLNVLPEIFSLVSDINSEVYGSRSIIHQAVREGKLDVIKKIPSIMYDSVDYAGNTPLYYAVKKDDYTIAKYLLKNGECDVCHLGKKSTPIHLAVKGRPKILKKILKIVKTNKYKKIFDINVKDRYQNSPLLAPFYLHPLKSNGKKRIDPTCLRMIIENGADITECDAEGNNILYYTFKFYFDINSDDFTNFILSKKELTLTEKGKKALLIQLYNQKNQHLINIFHNNFDINSNLMKSIFSECVDPSVESAYLILSKQEKGFDFFFECLKTANENVFNSMLEIIDGLLFFVDVNDNNNNVLFLLAISRFNSELYFVSILITIFKLIIKFNHDDFLFIQNKENGDNFLHLAIRRRNNLLIKIMLDIYQKKENQVLKEFSTENKKRIWSLVNHLFYMPNNDPNNKQNSIELGALMFSHFRNIFPLEIFQKIPSYNELENFLKKYQNPNIIQNGKPLIIKYVEYDGFDEDEMLRILELFNSYKCDFIIQRGGNYAAKILLKRYYIRAVEYLLTHHGVGMYAPKIMNIIDNSRKAAQIIDLYYESQMTFSIDYMINDPGESKELASIDDYYSANEIENTNYDLIDTQMLMNIINYDYKVKNIMMYIDNPRKEKEMIEIINKFKEDKKLFIIDIRKIDESFIKSIDKFTNYYAAFINLKKFIEYSNKISDKICSTIQYDAKYDENDEQFWQLLPIIQLYSTFNAHYELIIDTFAKSLFYESPIHTFLLKFLPFFEDIYGQFYIQILLLKNNIPKDILDQYLTDTSSIIGNFSNTTLFFAAFEGNISDLIKCNQVDSMKVKLMNTKEKCLDVIDKVQVFLPQYYEFNSVIGYKKITYDFDFDISKLSTKLYQVFVKIINYNLDKFQPPNELNNCYLICTDDVILLASIESEKVHFFYKISTSTVFFETHFIYVESKLTLFTINGMIEFQQTEVNNDNCQTLKNIGELKIKKIINKANELFIDEWNSQKNQENSQSKITVYIYHVDKTMRIIRYYFKFDRKADVEKVKEFGLKQITKNLYINKPEMMIFSLSGFYI